MKIQLSEHNKGIHVGEVWPSKMDHPITITIIESLGRFVPYIEGKLVSDSCKTLEEAAMILTHIIEEHYGYFQVVSQTERNHMLFSDERSQRSQHSTTLRTLSERAASRSRYIPSSRFRTQPSSLHLPKHVSRKRNLMMPALGGGIAASVIAIAALFSGGIISTERFPALDRMTIAGIYDNNLNINFFDFQFAAWQQTGSGAIVKNVPSENNSPHNAPAVEQPFSVARSTLTSSVVRTVVPTSTSGSVRTVPTPTSSVVRTVASSSRAPRVPTSSVVQTIGPKRETIVAGMQRSTSNVVTTMETIEPATAFQTTSAALAIPAPKPKKNGKSSSEKQAQPSAWQKFFGIED